MKASTILIHGAVAALAVLASGCDRGRNPSVGGIEQTKYPGQVTAGGATSGAIIARTAKPVTDATYAGGTPGIAGGSGGTTSGAEVGGAIGAASSGSMTSPGSTGRGISISSGPPSGATSTASST